MLELLGSHSRSQNINSLLTPIAGPEKIPSSISFVQITVGVCGPLYGDLPVNCGSCLSSANLYLQELAR